MLLHKTNATKTERETDNMAYIINVAKSLGRNWNDTGETYHHYFRIETDLLDISAKATGTGKTLTDLVEASYQRHSASCTLSRAQYHSRYDI